MERLTNDINILRAKAEEEVSLFTSMPNVKIIVFFSEFPCIAGFPFGFAILENEEGEIFSKYRQWDTQYDMDRWKNGIYNLNHLRILTTEYFFSSIETKEFHKIIADIKTKKLPKKLHNSVAISLDGSAWTLKINVHDISVNYTWKVPTKDITIFVPLIEMIIQCCVTNGKRTL